MSPNRFMRIDDDQDEPDDIPATLKGRIPTVQQTYDVPSTPPVGPPRRTAELQTVTEYVEVERFIEVSPANALVPINADQQQFNRCIITSTHLIMPDNATHDEWLQVGAYLQNLHHSIQWLVGDWVLYGQRVWKYQYDLVAQETGYDIQTVYDYAYVAGKIEVSIRNRNLSFSHHRVVANKTVDEQVYWLEQAALKNWTVQEMKAAINPPTLSDKNDRVGLFQRKTYSIIKRNTAGAEQGERMQMAALMRQWADEIENGK